MIQIRNNTFETNSSSVHMLVIPKDAELHIPSHVYLEGGEYGWEFDNVNDTINYVYQACLDAGQDEVDKFIFYLMDKGIDFDYYGQEKHEFKNNGFIDHSCEIPLEYLFKNRNMLDRFLFGGGWVDTGNDNSDHCPNEDDYDTSKYDVLRKGN